MGELAREVAAQLKRAAFASQFSAAYEAMLITALPSDVLSLVLAQLCLVRNIKGVKRTCRAFRDAAPAAEQAHRRVCFEHADVVWSVAAAPDGGRSHAQHLIFVALEADEAVLPLGFGRGVAERAAGALRAFDVAHEAELRQYEAEGVGG